MGAADFNIGKQISEPLIQDNHLYDDSPFGQRISSGIYFGKANQRHLSFSTMGDAPHVMTHRPRK